MKWATYLSSTDDREHAALLVDGELFALDGERQLIDLIGSPSALEDAAGLARSRPFEVVPVDGARLLSPIPRPPSVRDFMAFENHYVTSMNALGVPVNPVYYQQPVFYFQNPAAILGAHDPVHLAPGSTKFDYELEVAAIIGRPASNVTPSQAGSHIAGYTVLCDWSARDLQEDELTMAIGPAKAKDTATSMGPYLVTPDEIQHLELGNGFDLAMTASVNGAEYSSGRWSDQFWTFPELISYAARGTSLRTGDVIGAGTVGTGCILELARVHGEAKFPWLRAGDSVTLAIDELGAIRAELVTAEELHPLRPPGAQAPR